MMNRLVLVGSVGALLIACNNTPAICNLPNTLQSKLGSCADAGITFNNSSCAQSQCTSAYNQCTSSDQTTMNQYASCFSNLPACQAGQELTWSEQVLTCTTNAFVDGGLALSPACVTAFATQTPDGGCI
jgi:hypothetical protein